MGNEEAFLQTTAAAKLAGRSAETIRLWERTGILPAVRTSSGQRLFRASDVLAAVKTRTRRRRHVD